MPLLLSQKLRNYFHHVASLQTAIFHRKRREGYSADSHKELIEDLKKDGAYTGINGEILRNVKHDLIDFKWDTDLRMLAHKVQVAYECDDIGLEDEDYHVFLNLIENEKNNRDDPILTDHQKVLRYLEYHQKLAKYRLKTGIEDEEFEREESKRMEAYKNWIDADFGLPDFSND